MSNSTPSSYSKSSDGDYTVFTVAPGTHNLAGGLPILMILGFALLLPCFPVGLVLLGIHYFGKKKEAVNHGSKATLGASQPYYRKTTIRVKRGLLELPGDLTGLYGRSTLTNDEIHRFVTKNQVLEDLGYGPVYTSNNAAFNVGREMRLNMAKQIGWAVEAEAGGRSYTLVFGLNETTANGLMHDICRAMDGA